METRSLFVRLAELGASGRPVALATVVRTQGSTPQVVGAKMVIVDESDPRRAAGTLRKRSRGRPARRAAVPV